MIATMPTLICRANLTANPGSLILHFDDPTRGLFDTGIFGGPNDGVDIAEYVRSGQITRGANRFEGVYARAEAGVATVILDNRDRRFDPTNLAGPYVSAGETQITPMRAWWLQATWDGVTYDLWRGFADNWQLDYPAGGLDAITTLSGTDGTKVLANYDGVEQTEQGSGERTDQRIERILDNAGYPDTGRLLDEGLTTCQATTLAANAWTEVLLTSDTEIGETYFEADGTFTFRNRHAILTDSRSTTSQATFGDAGGSELPYSNIQIANDDTQVANVVNISRSGGTSQTAEDVGSQEKYLKRTFTRTDLVHESEGASSQYAAYVLSLNKDTELRFDSITIDPQADPDNLWPHVLGRRLGDRITVKLTPPGGGDRIERDAFIRGIEHNFTIDRWTTRFVLQDASKFTGFIFNSAINGVFDQNAFTY